MPSKGFKHNIFSTFYRTYTGWIFGDCYSVYSCCDKESFSLVEQKWVRRSWKKRREGGSSAVHRLKQNRADASFPPVQTLEGNKGQQQPVYLSVPALAQSWSFWITYRTETVQMEMLLFLMPCIKLIVFSARRCFWPLPRHSELCVQVTGKWSTLGELSWCWEAAPSFCSLKVPRQLVYVSSPLLNWE